MSQVANRPSPTMRQRMMLVLLPMALLPLMTFGAWAIYRQADSSIDATIADEARFVRAVVSLLEREVPAKFAGTAIDDNQIPRTAVLVKASAAPDQILVILPDDINQSPLPLAEGGATNLWEQIAEMRTRSGGDQVIHGVAMHITSVNSDKLKLRVVSARSKAAILSEARDLWTFYATAAIASLISTIIAIVVFARRVSTPILAAKRAADAWATGDLSARAADGAAPFHAETAALIDAFDGMAAAMRGTQLKTRVLYKSTTELFHCTDLDAVVRKAVELACTQCGADVAWFDPVGDKSDGTDERRQAGAWMWKQHRLHERTGKDMIGVWQRRDGDRVLSFSLKGQGKEIGILRAAFATAPDELGSTLIHSLAGLLDMAITKFDQGMRGAMLQTEVDMAEAVRRDLVEATREPERRGHVAFHYQPAQRFGGDWFHLIETDDGQVLYAVIGDVTGHGLVQGMITTAVKGALDAIEGLLKRGIESVASPSIIVSMLDGVVRRIASQHALAMTCVAVRIDFRTLEVRMCNAGHTFPILVRDEGGVSVAMHLHKEQQSMLGTEGVHTPYREAIYQLKPRDLLVLYTDGLTNARSFKSEVFGKFLFRSLKRRRDLGSAKSLRDEILAMFKYYTQNQRVDDDVCFLVTQIMPVERQVRDPRSSPAA